MADASDSAFANASEIKPSVLIFVDDGTEPMVPESLLFEAGYSAHTECRSGRLPDKHHHPLPDLIVWQIGQLGPDKRRELSRFKQDTALRDIGLVVLLGSGEADDAMMAIAAGADDCFIRPLDDRVLLMRLDYLTGRLPDYSNHDAFESDAGYFHYDIANGKQRFNQRISDIFGIEAAAISADPRCLWRAVHQDDFHRVSLALQSAPQKACDHAVEFRLQKPDARGRTVYLQADIVNIPDDGVVFGLIRDVSEVRRRDDQLLRQLNFDALTGLPNRRLLEQYLDENLPLLHASGRDMTVLLVDLDRFSRINNVYGQRVGDRVLQTLSKRLLGLMNFDDGDAAHLQAQVVANRRQRLEWPGSMLARISADGFVLCIPDYDPSKRTLDALQAVLKEMSTQPFYCDHHELFLTASVGMAVSDLRSVDADSLLQRADMAMHEAKREGRNRICQFEGLSIDSAAAQMDLHNDMRRALLGDEFHLQYQPKVDPKSGCLLGVEALIRWQHPIKGPISPAQFIPIAEETGLIVEIGDWVLRSACEQGLRWLQSSEGGIPIAVNVSARQFKDSRLVERILSTLKASGLPPSLLELEITEGAMIHGEGTIDAIRQLRDAGIRVALDDFGTGFSSLSYLLQFPIDLLKIDRSFIQNIDAQTDKSAIVGALTQMSKTLTFSVVAEGVESSEEMARVTDLGCDQVQGYFVSRPMTATGFQDWRQLH